MYRLSPSEITRYAKVRHAIDAARAKEMISLEYFNAAMQRAKRMPTLSQILRGRKQATLHNLSSAIKALAAKNAERDARKKAKEQK